MRARPVFLFLLLMGAAAPVAAQNGDAAGEAEMLGRINAMRNVQGLPPLERHAGLDAAARTHSADMAWHRMLDHVSPRTGDPAARVQNAGVAAAQIAENVAYNTDAIAAHQGLVQSDAHRANLMNPEFTHIGLSVMPDGNGHVYVTQVLARMQGEGPAPEAPAAEPEPAEEPDRAVEPWQGEASQLAPEPQAPTPQQQVQQPVPQGQQRIAGYWVYSQNRWWYYPMPSGAQPGQHLQPDLSVQGPPPGVAAGRYREGLTIPAVLQGPQQLSVQGQVGPVQGGITVQGHVPPSWQQPPPPQRYEEAPAFGWSPRRRYRQWYYSR